MKIMYHLTFKEAARVIMGRIIIQKMMVMRTNTKDKKVSKRGQTVRCNLLRKHSLKVISISI